MCLCFHQNKIKFAREATTTTTTTQVRDLNKLFPLSGQRCAPFSLFWPTKRATSPFLDPPILVRSLSNTHTHTNPFADSRSIKRHNNIEQEEEEEAGEQKRQRTYTYKHGTHLSRTHLIRIPTYTPTQTQRASSWALRLWTRSVGFFKTHTQVTKRRHTYTHPHIHTNGLITLTSERSVPISVCVCVSLLQRLKKNRSS